MAFGVFKKDNFFQFFYKMPAKIQTLLLKTNPINWEIVTLVSSTKKPRNLSFGYLRPVEILNYQSVIILRHILKNLKTKSSSQISPFFTRCFPSELAERSQHRLFTCLKFFSTNCRKFAVECDWNTKISQNVQNLGFF